MSTREVKALLGACLAVAQIDIQGGDQVIVLVKDQDVLEIT